MKYFLIIKKDHIYKDHEVRPISILTSAIVFARGEQYIHNIGYSILHQCTKGKFS